jgi:hypothetical protein
MDWQAYAAKPRSSKIALAHLFPKEKVRAWTNVSGFVYSLFPRAFVDAIHLGTVELTKVTGTPSANEWSYVPNTNVCLINTGADPRGQDVILTYRYCFATDPLILPYDLSTGDAVEYDGRIKNVDDLKLELDYENAGIALESTSSITLNNNDGFFDDLFDTLSWENQVATFYSYGREIAASDARVIFNGYIDTKSFSTKEFKLTIKDAFKKLRDKTKLNQFSDSDGQLNDSDLGGSKRRIYGRVKNLQCVGVDKTLDGYALTGTFAASVTDTTITGTGSNCLNELSPDDEITFVFNDTEFKYKVQTVDSATSFTVSQAIEAPLSGTLVNKPAIAYRGKNRGWHIAGHECHEIESAVVASITPTRVTVTSTDDFRVGDPVNYNNGEQFLNIQRITGSTIVFDQAISITPSGGETIVGPAVRAAYIGPNLLVADRDYSVINSSGLCVLELDSLAEFNITKPFLTLANFTFTNGSRNVTHNTADFDLTTILKPRDWIRAYSITRPTWFEILSVAPTSLVLRSTFTEASFTGNAERKNVTYVDDESLITVDCNGKRGSDNRWIKTASQAVADILEVDLAETNLNTTAFTEAETDAHELISYAIPKQAAGDAPVIRDIITDINRSVFGALYQDVNFQFAFSVLQADKSDELEIIGEDDILSYSSSSKPSIANKTRVLYQPFKDTFTGENSFLVEEFQNTPVDQLSGITNTAEVTCYLYDQTAAVDYAERLAFLKTSTNTNVVIKGKINLNKYGLGEKVILNLNRLFKRFGGESKIKTALVYGVSTDEANTTLSVNDFNAMFTRVPAISIDSASDYSSASDVDVARWGYIVDDTTETPDTTSDLGLGNNLIG